MATMNVKDAAGAIVAIEKPLAPGRAAAAASRPVALSSEDKDALDALKTVLGTKADAAATETDTTEASAVSVWKQISKSVQAIATKVAGTLTVATHAVTQSGDWILSAGTALIGKVTIGDGTRDVKVRAGDSAPESSDAGLVVALRPDSVRDTYAAYETVAPSQTDQVLGSAGAAGDYLAGILIVPAIAAAGAVSIKDGGGSGIPVFAGGGTTALPTLAPIFVPLGIYSMAGGWKVTTGSDVSVIAIGDFTDA